MSLFPWLSRSPLRNLFGRLIRLRSLLLGLCFWLAACCSLAVEAQTRPPIRWMRGDSTSQVTGGVLTPDNNNFITAGADSNIKIHRTSDGMLLRTLPMPDSSNVFALSPDGAQIATCGNVSTSATLSIWRLSDGALLKTIPHPTPGTVAALAWSPDGTRLAAAQSGTGAPNAVLVWDTNTGALVYTLNGHTDRPLSVAFSPDSSRLVSGSWDKTVRLWSMTDGSLLQTMTGPTARVTSVAITPDNHTIVSACPDGVTRLWDATTGGLLYYLNSSALCIAVSPDGKTFAGGTDFGLVFLWTLKDGTLLDLTAPGPDGQVLASVAYSKDGSLIFATTQSSVYGLYNSADLTTVHPLPADPSTPAAPLGLTPNGHDIVYVNEGILRIWNAATGAIDLQANDTGAPYRTNFAIAMSADGIQFATLDSSASRGVSLRIWSMDEGIVTLDEKLGSSSSVSMGPGLAWSADGQYIFYTIAPATGDNSIGVIKTGDGSLVKTIPMDQHGPTVFAVSPNGRWLAVNGSTSTAKLYDLSTFTLARNLVGPTSGCNALTFSADSARLLTGSHDNAAILWNVADGSILRTFAHPGPVSNVALAPDGNTLATGSNDGHLRLWSIQTGTLLKDYTDEGGLLPEAYSVYGPTLYYTQDDRSIVYSRLDSVIAVAENPYFGLNITSMTIEPSLVVGGHAAAGTIALSQPAPAGGALVTLTSDNAFAAVPANVTVPEGAASATFPIATSSTNTSVTVHITAGNDVSSTTGALVVTPPNAVQISASPATVKGGQNSTGTITISDPAPAGGVAVSLSSGLPSLVTLPATVTVPAGATTANFPIATQVVGATRTVTLFATRGSIVSTMLTLTPPTVDSLSVSPTSVKGGSASTGTVTISEPAPAGGITISLSSDKTVAAVSASVTVAAGSKPEASPFPRRSQRDTTWWEWETSTETANLTSCFRTRPVIKS